MFLNICRVEVEDEGISGCFFFQSTIITIETDSLARILRRGSRHNDIRNYATSPRLEHIGGGLLQQYNLSKVV
jgi:hypothetical protein